MEDKTNAAASELSCISFICITNLFQPCYKNVLLKQALYSTPLFHQKPSNIFHTHLEAEHIGQFLVLVYSNTQKKKKSLPSWTPTFQQANANDLNTNVQHF